MTDLLYFAYGSNMLKQRLVARCASAQRIGVAMLPRSTLAFDKISSDGSGKCTFEPSAYEQLAGVLWRLDGAERVALDRAEGVGRGYGAITVDVFNASRSTITAVTYQATARGGSLPVYDWYWALVVAGALQNGLPKEHVARLRQVAHVADPILERRTRLDALEALREAGYEELLDG